MKSHAAVVVLGLILVISGLRVGSTWQVFSQTYDESAHIAAGMEWLTLGSYLGEPQHPPLARVATALGPFLAGARAPKDLPLPQQGNEILHTGEYTTMLSLARAGILPFFLLSIVVVWLYARWLAGELAATAAAALYANQPTVLAHAALATTDMALACGVVLSLFLFHLWLVRPTIGRAVALGLALAMATASKFSALLFVPAAGAAMLVCLLVSRPRLSPQIPRRVVHLLVVGAVGAVAMWGVYRFSFEPLAGKHRDLAAALAADSPLAGRILYPLDGVPIPAPPLVSGISEMLLHNSQGHNSYLFGEHRVGSWWYYFPVALSVKTTITFLLASLLATLFLAVIVRRTSGWHLLAPIAAAVAILAASTTANVNIGVRHVLPIYPLLAIGIGCAVALPWSRSNRTRIVLVALFMIDLIVSVRSHPDYLAYFNVFAGRQPERILIDSNLDWGQDLLRLSSRAKELHIDSLRFSYFGTADLSRHDLPRLLPVSYERAVPGWFAVSISNLGSPSYPVTFAWLDQHQPVERVGKSILLYRISSSFVAQEQRALLDALEPLIVPLPLGRTPGAGRTWVSELTITNSGERSVELRNAPGDTFVAEPRSSSVWELTSPMPAALIYLRPEDLSIISGSVTVGSLIGDVPQPGHVVVPVIEPHMLSDASIALEVPPCNACRRMLRVYDSGAASEHVTITARQGDLVVTRPLILARVADAAMVAASAQNDLEILFPEADSSEELELVIRGVPEADAGRWAFVTLSGGDDHRVITPGDGSP